MTGDEKWLLEEKYEGVETGTFREDRARLLEGEPIAYVLNTQPFFGLTIHLDSRPLIPRPETEWWTEQLINSLQHHAPADALRFLDLCAGSGAIGCAMLSRLPQAQVSFGEIDPSHEATIEKNIRENNLDGSRATIKIGDLFEPFGDEQFDVIAANPPYVPSSRELPPSVGKYEPHIALFAGDDGLGLIRRIAADLPQRLKKGGVAWIECDRGHAEATRTLFEEQGFAAEIRTDQFGRPRIIVVSFP